MDNSSEYPDANQLYGTPASAPVDEYPDANALYGPSSASSGAAGQTAPNLPINYKLQNTADRISGLLRTINMGSGYSGPINDMDAENPLTTITNAANKAGDWLSGKLGEKGAPDWFSAGVGMVAATLGNPITSMTPMPSDVPIMPGAQEVAQNMGRRALGVTKGMIKNMPGGLDTANAKAQVMLDQKIPRMLSGAEGNLELANNALENSGQVIGTILKRAGTNAINTNDIASKIIDELAPSDVAVKGAYVGHEKLANDVIETVMAHGDGPIDLSSAQKLKNTLHAEAGANWQTAPLRAAAYQKAYMIVGDEMEKAINKVAESGLVPQNLLPLYQQQKQIYGAAKMAVSGLRDKAAAEAANNIWSLPGVVAGVGALATGNITHGLAALGFWEAARRYGAGATARAMNAVSKASIPAEAVNPAIAIGMGSSSSQGDSK